MHTRASYNTERYDKEEMPDALHQVIFAWGKRLFGPSTTFHAQHSYPSTNDDMLLNASSVRIGTVSMGSVSLSNWQQQTMTQLTHSLMLNLTKAGRDADASFVMHLHQIQRAGEISLEQCLERLIRLCPEEMKGLSTDIRAKLACITQGIH